MLDHYMMYATSDGVEGEDKGDFILVMNGGRGGLRAELRDIEETLVRAASIMEEGNPRFLKKEDINDALAWNTSSWLRCGMDRGIGSRG